MLKLAQDDPNAKNPISSDLTLFIERFLVLYIGPIIQAMTAAMLLIYMLSLLFSYEELFGRTRPDEPVHLTKSDIDLIAAKVERSKDEE